jgi:surfactin synthase thioesterase subunit
MQTFMKHHLCVAVARHSDLPFAFFGHRLAALLAFEVARACQRGALPMSRYLFVSGCGVARDHQPPGIPLGQDDDALISMKELSGVPDEFLEDRVVIATLLPTIQADPTMTLDYRYSDAAPLEIPMTVLAGSQNTHVDLARLDDWHLEANASCVVRRPLGSHFFIHSSRLALLDCLNRMLRDVC